MAKTRRTRIGAENGHRGATSPRLRIIAKETRGYPTSWIGYLRAPSDAIKYGRGLRGVGYETAIVLNGEWPNYLLGHALAAENTGLASHIRRAQPPTNPLNGGLFHATAATKPGCAGAGSGERHDETKNALLKHPNTSLSTARPSGGVHRHTATPRQRGGVTPWGRYPPTGGAACSERPYTSAIGARLVSFVIRRRRQWAVVGAVLWFRQGRWWRCLCL